jgi:hypothetical protein
MHEDAIFHTAALVLPVVHQQAYKSTTHLSITQDDYSFRHNSRQPKSTEENIPNGTSNLTIKKKIVHKLLICFAHTTPINHNDAPLLEVVHGKDPS